MSLQEEERTARLARFTDLVVDIPDRTVRDPKSSPGPAVASTGEPDQLCDAFEALLSDGRPRPMSVSALLMLYMGSTSYVRVICRDIETRLRAKHAWPGVLSANPRKTTLANLRVMLLDLQKTVTPDVRKAWTDALRVRGTKRKRCDPPSAMTVASPEAVDDTDKVKLFWAADAAGETFEMATLWAGLQESTKAALQVRLASGCAIMHQRWSEMKNVVEIL